MSKVTIQIEVDEELKPRLIAAAQQRRETLDEFVEDALYIYVEDVEDGVMSDVALNEEGLTYFSAERAHQHALDHPLLEAGRKTA